MDAIDDWAMALVMFSFSLYRLKGLVPLPVFLLFESFEEKCEDEVGPNVTGVAVPERLALDAARERFAGGSSSESAKGLESCRTFARAACGR